MTHLEFAMPSARQQHRSTSVGRGVHLTSVCLAAASVATVLAGCSHTPSSTARPPISAQIAATATGSKAATVRPQAPSTSPATGGPQGSSAALAAYVAMWQDYAIASHTSSWNSHQLAAHATGDALLTMERWMYADYLNKLVSKGEPTDRVKLKSATPAAAPTRVSLTDCGDDSHWLKYVKATGKLEDNIPGGHHWITADVVKNAAGTWKVATFFVGRVGSC